MAGSSGPGLVGMDDQSNPFFSRQGQGDTENSFGARIQRTLTDTHGEVAAPDSRIVDD